MECHDGNMRAAGERAEQCQGREGRIKEATGDRRTLEGIRRSGRLTKGLLGGGAEGELRRLSRVRPGYWVKGTDEIGAWEEGQGR